MPDYNWVSQTPQTPQTKLPDLADWGGGSTTPNVYNSYANAQNTGWANNAPPPTYNPNPSGSNVGGGWGGPSYNPAPAGFSFNGMGTGPAYPPPPGYQPSPFTSSPMPSAPTYPMPDWATYQPPSYGGPTAGQNWNDYYNLGGVTPGTFPNKNEPWQRWAENTLPIVELLYNMQRGGYQDQEAAKQFWANFGMTGQNNQVSQQQNQQTIDINKYIAQNQAGLGAAELNQNAWIAQLNNLLGWGGIGAQNYASELGYQGQMGSAGLYSEAQKYGADQQLAGTMGSAGLYSEAQKYGAQTAAEASKYGAQLGLQGQMGSAGLYSEAQKYGADLGLQGTQYSANVQQQIAMAADLTQRYGIDAQTAWRLAEMQSGEQIAREQMAAQERMAVLQATGRRQPMAERWVRNW